MVDDMRVEESIGIDRPVQEVIDCVSEAEKLPGVDGDCHRGKQRAPGPIRESKTFTAVVKFLGHRIEMPYERTSHEPNRHFTELATAGPLPALDLHLRRSAGKDAAHAGR